MANAATANEADIPKASVRQVRRESPSEVPTHVNGLLDDIRINAPPDVRDEAVWHSHIFTVSELDLGEFTAIEHHIEIG